MMKLIKYPFLALLVFFGYNLLQAYNSEKELLDPMQKRASNVLEYMYAKKLDKPMVICEPRSYERTLFVKCHEKNYPSYWRVESQSGLQLVAVEGRSAAIARRLSNFKELRIDREKLQDASYKRALGILFN